MNSTVAEQLEELAILKDEADLYAGRCKTELIGEFRQSARKWAIPRAIIRFLTNGRLCSLGPYAYNSEIVRELENTVWWKEIDKLAEIHQSQIHQMEQLLLMRHPDDEAIPEITEMMDIISSVVCE